VLGFNKILIYNLRLSISQTEMGEIKEK